MRSVFLFLLVLSVVFVPLCNRGSSAQATLPEPSAEAARANASIRVEYSRVVTAGPKYYGVEYGWVDQDRDLFLERYRTLNPNLLRVQVTQEAIEPVNDNLDSSVSVIDFNRTLPLDDALGKTLTYRDMFTTLAREFPQMHFHINVWLAARWNATDPDGYLGLGGAFPPLNYAEHGEFIWALAEWLVQTCGIAPQRLSFTFVNEPNLDPFFQGNTQELAQMAQVTRRALDAVSPSIRLGGLEEVHGTAETDAFARLRSPDCCDFWTYHVYESGAEAVWNSLAERREALAEYGPVWVTEFADTNFGSPDAKMDFSSREAGLQFAALAGRMWGEGYEGIIHFRLADTFVSGGERGGWAGHGLFADWRGTNSQGSPYALYPSYWAFANLYNQFGGAQVVQSSAPPGLTLTAARRPENNSACLTLWATNMSHTAITSSVEVHGFPKAQASVQVLDNLTSPRVLRTLTASGAPLTFRITIPAQSSYSLVVRDAGAVVTPTPTLAPTGEVCTRPGCRIHLPYLSLQGQAIRPDC